MVCSLGTVGTVTVLIYPCHYALSFHVIIIYCRSCREINVLYCTLKYWSQGEVVYDYTVPQLMAQYTGVQKQDLVPVVLPYHETGYYKIYCTIPVRYRYGTGSRYYCSTVL